MAAKYLNWADGKCADTVFEARFDYNHATSIDTVPYFVEYYVMDDDGAYPARPVRSYASILQNVREGSLYDIPRARHREDHGGIRSVLPGAREGRRYAGRRAH